MRLPFISRRRAQANTDMAVRAVWHFVEQAEDQTTAELGRRLDAEYALTDARKELDKEREKRDRLKAYMVRTHTARYEQRIGRLRSAAAGYRAEAAVQRRVIRRLTDQLLDATGYQGEHLYPDARTTLGITDKEDQ